MATTSNSQGSPKSKPVSAEALATRMAAALDTVPVAPELGTKTAPETPVEAAAKPAPVAPPPAPAKAPEAAPSAPAPVTYGPDLDGMYRLVKDGITRVSRTMETVQDAARDTTTLVIGSRSLMAERGVGIQRKLLEMMELNFTTGLKTMQAIARAGNVADAVSIQSTYCQEAFKTLTTQAEVLRVLSTELAHDVREPFREQVTTSVERMKAVLRPH